MLWGPQVPIVDKISTSTLFIVVSNYSKRIGKITKTTKNKNEFLRSLVRQNNLIIVEEHRRQ